MNDTNKVLFVLKDHHLIPMYLQVVGQH